MRSNKHNCELQVKLHVHTEYVLAHYLMIDQLSATANSRHQKTLEISLGSPWPTIISEWQHANSRIVACSAVCSLYTSSTTPILSFQISFSDIVPSNDTFHSGCAALKGVGGAKNHSL